MPFRPMRVYIWYSSQPDPNINARSIGSHDGFHHYIITDWIRFNYSSDPVDISIVGYHGENNLPIYRYAVDCSKSISPHRVYIYYCSWESAAFEVARKEMYDFFNSMEIIQQ
jgi:hypothetical protein